MNGRVSSDAVDAGPDFGSLLTFHWAIIHKPLASGAFLSDPHALRPTFTVDVAGDYVVQLYVHDGTEASEPDTIVVSTGDIQPWAEAEDDQMIAVGATAQLDSHESQDFGGDPVTRDWALIQVPAGSTASLDDPTAVFPNLDTDLNGTYVAQLIVNDGSLDSRVDGVIVDNGPVRVRALPSPNATISVGTNHAMVANFADNDGYTVFYRWSLIARPPGSTATLDNPSNKWSNFTPDKPGDYLVQLIVGTDLYDSHPRNLLITATNTAPLADAGPDQTVLQGATVQLDGTASSDPDGDPLGYMWTLTVRPAGSTATIANPTAAQPSFVPDLAGAYTAQLIVNDGSLSSAPDSVAITADPAPVSNQPPVLDPIGNHTVDLGSSLTFTLTGSDPDGDPISFTAMPLPLPTGATLDGTTGVFKFTPEESQVGAIDLTFMVSDGFLTDSEAVTITVNGPPVGGVTALTGRLLDAIDADNGVTTPVVGATVSMASDPLNTVVSDSNGDFTLSGIGAGSQVLEIDTTTANLAPNGDAYGSFHEEIELIADVTTDFGRPIYLPRVDPAGTVTVDPAVTNMVTNTNIDVTLEIPANTAMDEQGNAFTGDISVSEVPLAFAPMELPAELQPSLLISIQPVGVTFTQPVPHHLREHRGPGARQRGRHLLPRPGDRRVPRRRHRHGQRRRHPHRDHQRRHQRRLLALLAAAGLPAISCRSPA